ncbi:hypothetical protein [Acinetobacter sp. NIPH 2100]|uniref:hypothetical protein n=1 Tax=Acinetobacter sp. NIPH 2100 TaxID=1217708 RepID=UPI0002CE97FE|nr:hypothetical protein [Acinetobacter sp. NIPH 2100]ENX38160.1 hypothetical protein F887_03321 [Acinetobacter sp. NIPH 2100]
MKQIAAFLIVLLALGLVVFYLKPSEQTPLKDDVEHAQVNAKHSDITPTLSDKEETVTTEQTNSHKLNELKSTEKDPQLYDTKSDPSIQPIDPDTDPANQIEKL